MIPLATYRLQLHGGFTFDDARQMLDYLRDLGISHVYCSPYLQAAKGSTHGYDVVDHNRLNEELGGTEGHTEFVAELKHLGLGQILDIVPNHMAIGDRANKWWWDVLENGPSSRFAHYFDVDWEPPEARFHNLTLLPVLGDHYGRILENGELTVHREGGRFVLRYADHVFPLSPRSLPDLLSKAAERAGSEELAFIADVVRALPAYTSTDAANVRRRHRDKEIAARQIAELCSGEPRIAEAVDQVLHELNRDVEVLDQLLSNQNFRLAYWRTAGRELGYRRFFDINTLVGLRTEDYRVLQDTHCLIFDWLRTGVLDGVRIDHPDGLRDPQRYFERLRNAFPKAYIVAEKILEPGEQLRENWPIAGTTGYEFLNRVGGLFIDPRGEEPLTRTYTEFTGVSSDFHEMVRERKHQVLRGTLGSDVNRLTAQFMDVCENHRRFRDFTRHQIHQALREVIACFPVYRTYVRADLQQVDDLDRRYVNEAVSEAKKHRPDIPPDLFDFMCSILLLEHHGPAEGEFVMRFQQFTGPAMAKGVEDTAFYVFNRLTSLNEVGGSPGQFGVTPDAFHKLMTEAQAKWPVAMLATSTHDTKRSEDVRCRLHLLSEIPGEWSSAVAWWSEHNNRHRENGWPDRNTEYLLYQSLVGAWPIDEDRMLRYMEKASREAKTHTSWTDPDPAYDSALRNFVQALYADSEFMRDIGEFAVRLIEPGRVNSLAQTLVKLTAPGVPDTYQGTEIWDLSLVDPDNRRPVDYGRRKNMLRELESMTHSDVMTRADEGFPKLWLVKRALALRQSMPECFGDKASYTPLYAAGSRSDHVVGYLRTDRVMVVVPRLVLSLANDWQDTVIRVPAGRWSNVMTTGEVTSGDVQVRSLLSGFPVALLKRE
jgi:(1->4)-alpha-D-glucan 1-alpha-D-glucosylmutase